MHDRRPFTFAADRYGNVTLQQELFALVQLRPVAWQRGGQGEGAKSTGPLSAGGPRVPDKKIPVTVKIKTSGYQTLECFIATLPT